MGFWLEVKKEYIIEDFEKVLSYLRDYKYDKDGDNTAFDKTLKALDEVVADICKWADGSSLTTEADRGGLSDDDMLRMVAAYLLAKDNKGEKDTGIFLKLICILFLLDIPKIEGTIIKLRDLSSQCFQNIGIDEYGFSWSDIFPKKSFFQDIFCEKLACTTFLKMNRDCKTYYEMKGLLLCDQGNITLAPTNYTGYRSGNFLPQISFDNAKVQVCVSKKDRKSDDSIEKLKEINNSLRLSQSGAVPSPKKRLKQYDLTNYTEKVAVRITSKTSSKISARTIDGSYEPLTGFIKFNLRRHMLPDDFITDNLREGDVLLVNLQDNPQYPFNAQDSFEEFYKDYANERINRRQTSVFITRFNGGTRWMSEDGLLLNIFDMYHRFSDDETTESSTISIKVRDVAIDSSGKAVTNGEYDGDESDCAPEDFQSNALSNLLDSYIDWCDENCYTTESHNLPYNESPDFAKTFSLIEYSLSKHCSEGIIDRFKKLIVARMAASLYGNEKDSALIQHELNYLSEIAKFAKGVSPATLKLSHEEILEGNEEVLKHEKIIKELNEFPQDIDNKSTAPEWSKEDAGEQIRSLITAANVIAGNSIVQKESVKDDIRKILSNALGSGQMFRSRDNTSTYYGTENRRLEFKSSYVFRTADGVPDPDTQKWETLRSICGFLNSMNGGELLLGVRNDGHACGLEDDINELFKRGDIPSPDIDQFMNHVMREVHHAFKDCGSHPIESRLITLGRVDCSHEEDNRGHVILRFEVRPYENGIVEFSEKDSLPAGIEPSYIRSATSTRELTRESMQKILDNKKDRWKDDNRIKVDIIRKAIHDRKNIILRDYISHSDTRDRHVEPYKYLADNNAIICYDLDVGEVREYKLDRTRQIDSTEESWTRYKRKYEKYKVDIFDMMGTDEDAGIHIVLKLGRLPYDLLLEEHEGAAQFVHDNAETDSDYKDYPYILDTTVFRIEGIGRFYVGLAPFIKIVEGDDLKAYAQQVKEIL